MANELNHALVDAFYLICEEEESSASIEAVRNAALDKIKGGEAKSLVSQSLNGYSFNYQVNGTAIEVFTAASRAIRKWNRGLIKVSEVDFSCI